MAKRFRVRVQQTINVSLSRAWEAWTTARGWDGWFSSRTRLDLKSGGRYQNADHDTGRFIEIRPKQQLRFSWDNPKACPGTLVTVRFQQLGPRRCRVTLTHSRLAAPERGPSGCTAAGAGR
jgi:uncharacterized protein YndB with AHSA1/START domain